MCLWIECNKNKKWKLKLVFVDDNNLMKWTHYLSESILCCDIVTNKTIVKEQTEGQEWYC